jgi:hypothetical protein
VEDKEAVQTLQKTLKNVKSQVQLVQVPFAQPKAIVLESVSASSESCQQDQISAKSNGNDEENWVSASSSSLQSDGQIKEVDTPFKPTDKPVKLPGMAELCNNDFVSANTAAGFDGACDVKQAADTLDCI